MLMKITNHYQKTIRPLLTGLYGIWVLFFKFNYIILLTTIALVREILRGCKYLLSVRMGQTHRLLGQLYDLPLVTFTGLHHPDVSKYFVEVTQTPGWYRLLSITSECLFVNG